MQRVLLLPDVFRTPASHLHTLGCGLGHLVSQFNGLIKMCNLTLGKE